MVILEILAKNWLSCKILLEQVNLAESIRTRCYLVERLRIPGHLTGTGDGCILQKNPFSVSFQQSICLQKTIKENLDRIFALFHKF